MTKATTTTDHEQIRRWVEERNGRPARVRDSKGEGGILRIDFGTPEESLEPLEWDEFFRIFDENRLAFIYQDKTADGAVSRFNKLIDRD